MRFWLMVLVIVWASAVWGADGGRRAETEAAAANAVVRLHDEIASIPIDRAVTVGQFIDATGNSDDFLKVLGQAEEIGGPRWIDDQTCQVQLQISGRRIARLLNDIALARPRESPIAPERLARLTESLADQDFSATGTSTGNSTVNLVQGIAPDNPWAAVGEKEREQAVSAARDDAVSRVLDSLKSVHLNADKTVGDALADANINQQATAWLEGRPVTRIELREDMQAVLTLSATPGETFDLFRGLLIGNAQLSPAEPAGWEKVREEFAAHMAAPVGQAALPAPAVAAPPPPNFPLPGHAPDWVARTIGANAIVSRDGSPLKTARIAEAEARKALRAKIEGLPFGKHQTLGDLAPKYKQLADIISQSVDAALVTKTDYDDPRGVKVWVELDGQTLWDALHGEE